jgi:DNA-binding transcriptional MerR regulator
VGESAADIASIRDTLKKKGYSEKAIKEVLKWYDSSPKAETPQENKG